MKMDVITMSMPGAALKRDRLGRLGRAFCGPFGGQAEQGRPAVDEQLFPREDGVGRGAALGARSVS